MEMFIKNCIQTKVAAPKSCLVSLFCHDKSFFAETGHMQGKLLKVPEPTTYSCNLPHY